MIDFIAGTSPVRARRTTTSATAPPYRALPREEDPQVALGHAQVHLGHREVLRGERLDLRVGALVQFELGHVDRHAVSDDLCEKVGDVELPPGDALEQR